MELQVGASVYLRGGKPQADSVAFRRFWGTQDMLRKCWERGWCLPCVPFLLVPWLGKVCPMGTVSSGWYLHGVTPTSAGAQCPPSSSPVLPSAGSQREAPAVPPPSRSLNPDRGSPRGARRAVGPKPRFSLPPPAANIGHRCHPVTMRWATLAGCLGRVAPVGAPWPRRRAHQGLVASGVNSAGTPLQGAFARARGGRMLAGCLPLLAWANI